MEFINNIFEAFKGKNSMRAIIAIVSILFAFGYTIAITFIPIPEPNIRFADVSQGFIMGTIVAGVIGFYFGTSQGSVDKNQIIKDQQH
jgi:hypothetical protein